MVAEEVQKFLSGFQERLNAVSDDAIYAAFERSERAASEQAGQTLYKVQQAVGLRPEV